MLELSFESGLLKTSVGSKPSASLLLSVNCLPIISGILPFALTSSKITSVFNLNSDKVSFVFASITLPLYGSRIISCPIIICETSISIGKAPESSRVLKNIGAIFPPKQKPPSFLLGIKGISSPMCHKTELVADFLEEPVPTTSPTKTRGFPLAFCLSISFNGSCKPVLGILNIARACRGISGLDQASGAGDKSSVFISPVTLKTVSLI